MPNSSLPSGSGQVDTETQPNGDHRQVMALGDPVATTVVGSRPDGFLNVRDDPTTLLFDTFETVDTVNTWTLAGSVPPAQTAAGQVTGSAGTAAGATSWARSQPTFQPGTSAFLQYASIVQIEAGVVTGATRWWGLAVPNTTPTTGLPITNGTIFEVDAATGALFGRVYSNGALTQSLALTRPADGTIHRYQILYRASRVFFNIDNVEVGSLPFPSPTVGRLPVSFGSVNGGTALATAPVLNLTLVGVGDTAGGNLKMSDGVYPWRTARVTPSGELYITDSNRFKQSLAIVHSGRLTVGAAADAATAGRLWLINPIGSTVLLELRRVEFSSAPTAATAFPTSPRVTVERVTFTGTATGATIAPAARDTNDAALQGRVLTASTGLTLTAGAAAYGFMVAPILTAVGAAVPVMQEWEPSENGRLVLRPGQGAVIRQADAGTTADTRSFQVNLAWAEYTVMT